MHTCTPTPPVTAVTSSSVCNSPPSGKIVFPPPRITGMTISRSSSTSPSRSRVRTRVGLPITTRSPPSASWSSWRRTTASSPGMRVVFSQVRSSSLSVADTTCFEMAFIRSANGSPARSGHAAAIVCHVRRPNSNASALVSASVKAPPTTSGSKNGCDQPPCAKPPSVSSSGPPGACTTPSTLMNSMTTIRIVHSSFVG